MILCTDVAYDEQADCATAAGVAIRDWDSSEATAEWKLSIDGVEPYQPGQFYRRELPCLEQLLTHIHGTNAVSSNTVTVTLIVVDGYVWLDDQGRRGLGAHLYAALNEQIPIVGVAKTSFANTSQAIPVLRGESKQPLYVTAAGIEPTFAAQQVKRMAGDHRLPTALKRVDQLARSGC